jgi:hypothetical protein
MTLLAIEVNDAGIRAVKDTAPGLEAFPASPGIALWNGDALLTGGEAARLARLKPRWSHDRFWQEIDTASLPQPFPPRLRSADLLHAHLQEIWKATQSDVDEVILAIPGAFSAAQLGLILGVARACRIPVSGLVDQAVAASHLARGDDDLIHLDIHLHRAIATRVKTGQYLERTEIAVDDEVGMGRLFDTWVKFLAQAFVRTTRFDPLHRGETEQALYQRLPAWLDALRQEPSAVLAMQAPHEPDKEYAVELTREQIVSAAAPLLERLARLARSLQKAGEHSVLLVTPTIADLPGAADLLGSELNVISLPAAAGAMGAVKMKEAIRAASYLGHQGHHGRQSEEGKRARALPFITRLPLGSSSSRLDPVISRGNHWGPPSIEGRSTVPTHVLCDGVAHPVTSRPLALGLEIPEDQPGIDLGAASGATAGISRLHCTIYERDGSVVLEDHSRYGTFLNDQRVEGKATLAAGDRLRLGTPGVELRLIKVANSHGTTPRD